jgi:two-component system, cell cycle sensor histidine kinase and response regulator CckA
MATPFETLAADDREIVALEPSGCLIPLGGGAEPPLVASRDLVGQVLWELVHPDDIAAVHGAVREVFLGAVPRAVQFRVQSQNAGWRALSGTLQLIDGETPPRATLHVSDVTEPGGGGGGTHPEEEQLRHAGRLEVLGRLAGSIAHDFGNLLTVIIGDIGRVLDGLPRDSDVRPPAESVRAAAERAAGKVRQLLAFSRSRPSAPDVIDLNELLGDAEQLLRRLLGEHIVLRIIRGPGLWPVRVDRTQIEQVLFNLAVNGRDAMPAGGELTIETRNVPPDALPVTKTMVVDWCVSISVTDTGVGMDHSTQSRAFEPFFTTKGPERGTGLGLATVRQIANDSGGWVHLSSQPGQGSTITFHMPRAYEAPMRVIQPEPILRGGTETLLVVEDEARVRELVADMLDLAGYDVLTAATPAIAEQVSAERDATIHLLLTDVVMPDMSGFDLARRLRAARPGLRVVYMSGYPKPMFGESGDDMASARFIAKPFDRQSLLRSIRQALDSPDAC